MEMLEEKQKMKQRQERVCYGTGKGDSKLFFYVIENSVTLHSLSRKKRPKKQDADAHSGVRKIVAKRQRHPLGAAKCESPVVQ